jgi:hypothetical protein
MVKNKEITIDELTIMVRKRFQSMNKEMNKCFDGIEDRIAVLDARMTGIESGVITMLPMIINESWSLQSSGSP